MSVINTNVKSLVAQDSIMKSNRTLSTAMERLSTGKRINSAADDAAGLSISTRMDSQIRGLSQAIRNANDGISIVQTAEGAIDEVTNILQRMRELSVQSVNDSYNEADRSSMDQEVQQLKTEIDRIATTTEFNSKKLLDGSFKDQKLQIGDKSYQTMDINIASMKVADLGMGPNSVGQDTLVGARSALTSYADGDIKINGVGLEAFASATDDIADVVDGINERVDNVKASAFNVVTAKERGTGVTTAGQLTITVDVLGSRSAGTQTTTAFAIAASNNMDELVANINAQAGGAVTASINDDGKLVLSNDSGAKISVIDSSATATTWTGGSGFKGAATAFNGFLKVESTDGNPVRIERGNLALAAPGAAADLAALGFRENIQNNPSDAYTVTSANLTAPTTAWAKSDITINGVEIFDPSIATNTFEGKLEAINKFSSQTGVTASAYFEKTIDTTATFTGADGTEFDSTDKVVLNGVSVALGASVTALAANINAVKGQTGLEARVDGLNLVLSGNNVTGLNLSAEAVTGDADQAGTNVYLGLASATVFGTNQTTYGSIQLNSTNNTPISIELSEAATTTTTAHGFLEQNVGDSEFNINAASLAPTGNSSLSGLNVLSSGAGTKAIDLIDRAIEQVNKERGNLGAIENRLDKTVNNLTNIVTNTAASKSRIFDTDYGVETTNLAKAQIIQQAATAMLAQANQSSQSVLSLLK